MFAIALSHLVVAAAATPRLGRSPIVDDRWLLAAWILLYLPLVAELIAHLAAGSRHVRQNVLYCLIPPLRMAAREHEHGRAVWLPRVGWCRVGPELAERLARAWAAPMILVALAVLPVLAIEYFWEQRLEEHPILLILLHAGACLIWLAFAIELILMVSVVDKKLRYCRENWLDVVIVLAPFVVFLQALRITRLLRLQQAARLAKAYRTRGVLMRVYRAVLALELVHRLLRVKPERRLRSLESKLEEKSREIEALEAEIHEVQRLIAAEQSSTDAARHTPLLDQSEASG